MRVAGCILSWIAVAGLVGGTVWLRQVGAGYLTAVMWIPILIFLTVALLYTYELLEKRKRARKEKGPKGKAGQDGGSR